MAQNSKTESPLEEIHRIRREISDRFNGDLAAIAEDAARRLAAEGRPVWQPKVISSVDAIPFRRVNPLVRDSDVNVFPK